MGIYYVHTYLLSSVYNETVRITLTISKIQKHTNVNVQVSDFCIRLTNMRQFHQTVMKCLWCRYRPHILMSLLLKQLSHCHTIEIKNNYIEQHE